MREHHCNGSRSQKPEIKVEFKLIHFPIYTWEGTVIRRESKYYYVSAYWSGNFPSAVGSLQAEPIFWMWNICTKDFAENLSNKIYTARPTRLNVSDWKQIFSAESQNKLNYWSGLNVISNLLVWITKMLLARS